MDESVATTCSRCGAAIVVMTAGEYLSITDAGLDFALHLRAGESHIAIKSEEGAYACPNCGKGERMAARKVRDDRAST